MNYAKDEIATGWWKCAADPLWAAIWAGSKKELRDEEFHRVRGQARPQVPQVIKCPMWDFIEDDQ